MQRYFARIVRAVVVCTLGFGGGAGLFFFICCVIFNATPNAFEMAWKAGLIVGLIFSAIIVAILLPMDLSAHLFLSKNMYREVWELEQTRDVEVEGTNKDVIAACRQALLVVPYVTNVSDDTEHLITRARTGHSWRSAGEEIEVEINPITANRWSLKCTSKSKGKNVLFDYGKNYENVETWSRHLSQLLHTTAVESSDDSRIRVAATGADSKDSTTSPDKASETVKPLPNAAIDNVNSSAQKENADTASAIKTDTESAIKTDTESVIKTDTESAIKTDTESVIKTDTESVIKTDTESAIKTDPA